MMRRSNNQRTEIVRELEWNEQGRMRCEKGIKNEGISGRRVGGWGIFSRKADQERWCGARRGHCIAERRVAIEEEITEEKRDVDQWARA